MDLFGRPQYRTRMEVAGDAGAMFVNGQAIQLSNQVPVREVTLVAAVMGALALAWTVVQRATAPIVIPLFSRITGRQALDNDQRARIFQLIRSHPFIHHCELQRLTGLGFGTVAYHLRVLRREGLILHFSTPREKLYYPSSMPLRPEAAQARAALRQPTRRRVAKAVLASGSAGATQISLAVALGISRAQTCRLLNDLQGAGLVDVRGKKGRRYGPTELLKGLGGL